LSSCPSFLGPALRAAKRPPGYPPPGLARVPAAAALWLAPALLERAGTDLLKLRAGTRGFL
jgi:hypothetical protein